MREKYIRWVLGLDWNTPGYIVREESNKNKMRVETGSRAMRYEIRMGRDEESKILFECDKERKRDERKNEWTDENDEKRKYLWRCGVGVEEWENSEKEVETLCRRDIEVQKQENYNSIEMSRYNVRYKEIKAIEMPIYLKNRAGNNKEYRKILARASGMWKYGKKK